MSLQSRCSVASRIPALCQSVQSCAHFDFGTLNVVIGVPALPRLGIAHLRSHHLINRTDQIVAHR